MIENADVLSVFLPMVMGIAVYAAGKANKSTEKHVGWLSALVALIPIILIGSMIPDVMDKGAIRHVYPWIPSIGVTFGFQIDALSVAIAFIIALVSFFATVYAIGYMEHEHGHAGYFGNTLLFIGGMLGVVFSSNLLQFYVFWELMLIPSYFLIVFWGTPERAARIGFKYFIFTHVGAVCLLFGILTTFALTHTFEISDLAHKIGEVNPNTAMIIFVLMLFGFMVKMAVFPVHTWLPDAHSEAPTPISAMLSGVMIKCGAYAITRISLGIFFPSFKGVSTYLMALAVVTMVYGGLMAFAQTDVKRLFAYSSVSQMGYILFGLTTVTVMGLTGGLFHIVNHAFCKAVLFMSSGILMHQTKTRDLRQYGGLMGKMPMTALASVIGALTLAGTPPLSGFFSESMMFAGGINPEMGVFQGQNLLTFIATVSAVITAAYYLWFLWRVFFGKLPDNLKDVKEAPPVMWVPTLCLAIMALVLGIYPQVALNLVSAAAELILGPGH
ncbi:NADH-quinone oxidoreductase subunit M [Candidatus Bathyarchaeota archaeon]|nr:NADH-quinone oxidoreductase subunit M [Candidatus Bathyarchaeota archaeon]